MKQLICRFSRHFFIFLAVSFAGWLMETVSLSLNAGRWQDRGFLHLPFCTIYGACVLVIYALIGTPQSGGLLLKGVKIPFLRYSLYGLLAAGIPVTAELITGVVCQSLFDLRLWDYQGHRFHFLGYISLEMAFVWGFAVCTLMWGVYPWLERQVGRISLQERYWASVVFGIVMAGDWIICILR